MTTDTFWHIISEARYSGDDCEQITASVTKQLQSMLPTDILGFCRHMDDRLAESYRHDLWAVAYIVNGGCSDDGFEYFRGWLISQGRDYFEAALAQPERAADRAEPERDNHECEDILYAPARLYTQATGQPLPPTEVRRPFELIGTSWSEDDLETLYPELCERFFS